MNAKFWICLLLVGVLLFGALPSFAVKKPVNPPPGVLSLAIDPIKNRLDVLVDNHVFKRYPIALGKPETPTPVGDWKVIKKAKDWGTGFGTRWIGLNVPWGFYGIHGTNKPGSIGQDLSHGCVRMYNRDVEELYEWVQLGTRVTIYGHPMREPNLDPRRLAAGDVGIDVQLVQSRLKSAGYFHGTCDGRFGQSTENAVRAYEKAHHYQVDGVVGLREYLDLGLFE